MFINSDLATYFFGPEFRSDVAEDALISCAEGVKLVQEAMDATARNEPHFGLQLVCYTDLDTGLFMALLKNQSNSPSMISYYVRSGHRFFGGQTLMCVPFQFCTTATSNSGEYLVYRHTFKEPILSESEIKQRMNSGSNEERISTFALMRSRDGYRSIPGKSYVGITKRHWGERYIEHIESALSHSSSTLFHQAIRDMEGKKVICVHDVSAFGISEVEAKKYECHLIKTSSLAPKGLNMKVG